MPDHDTEMRRLTCKDEDFEVGQRVFYTLDSEGMKKVEKHDLLQTRQTKMLGLLTQHLVKKGIMTETELDDLLMEAIH
jgi:hypothetical protein